MTFESYLQDKFSEQYTGLDDEMPDAFNEWLCDLDVDAWMMYGQLYGQQEFFRGGGK